MGLYAGGLLLSGLQPARDRPVEMPKTDLLARETYLQCQRPFCGGKMSGSTYEDVRSNKLRCVLLQQKERSSRMPGEDFEFFQVGCLGGK